MNESGSCEAFSYAQPKERSLDYCSMLSLTSFTAAEFFQLVPFAELWQRYHARSVDTERQILFIFPIVKNNSSDRSDKVFFQSISWLGCNS